MIGTFRFYQNGKKVAESRNVITTEGKRLITRYLAGQSKSLGEAIGLGVGATAATAADVRLTFEVARVAVDLKNADYTNNVVVYKGTLPQDDVYQIYEMGLWSQNSNVLAAGFESRSLTTFDLIVEPWTNVTADAVNVRTSADAAKVTVTASATVSVRNASVQMDLSGYSGNDQVNLAFYKPDNNIAGITFAFEDQTTGGTLKSPEQVITGLPVGYNIISVAKSAFTQTGTISWASINRYGVDVRASATGSSVTLDSIRIEDTDTVNRDYVLISHSVLGAPLVKTSSAPMDVEYALDFVVT